MSAAMTSTHSCPHCGHAIAISIAAVRDRSEILLNYLARTPSGADGRERQVYLAAGGSGDWCLTYSGDLPQYRPFRRADIDKLLARDLIERAYPDSDHGYVLKRPHPHPEAAEK